ncbi:MAG: dienelactone hydrolase family protein [Myxococcales bacterium]|nr:dienelactone hydrolase family protein [Myxococcales bacterium]
MQEQQIEVATPDGRMPTFIAHPEGEGPFPVVLVLMDGLGFREALCDVARRLAATGVYAMLPDLYYRAGPIAPIERDEPGEWDRMMSLVQSLSDDRVVRDAEALLDHANGDAAARANVAGVMGFCLGGRMSVVVSQGLGPRIVAAAAIHPGNLASDGDDSPHRHVDRVAAELYLAIADQDQWCTPEQVSLMEKALVERGVTFETEWHRGALHGFGVPGGDSYHEQASERVWERLQALFSRTLR